MLKGKGLALEAFKSFVVLVLVLVVSVAPVYGKGKDKRRVATLTPEITKEIVQRSNYYGIDSLLILEIARQESSFNPMARSSANARGLMQFIPSTAARFGVNDPHNVAQSVDGACRYLSFLIRKFDGKLDLVLAGYNAGEHNVEKYGNKVPPFAETQNYVRTIIGNYKRALQVKEAFIKANGIVLTQRCRQTEIVTYKSILVVRKKALNNREVQRKLDELNNFSTAKDKLVAVKEVN